MVRIPDLSVGASFWVLKKKLRGLLKNRCLPEDPESF